MERWSFNQRMSFSHTTLDPYSQHLYLISGVFTNGYTANARVLRRPVDGGEWEDLTSFGLLSNANPTPTLVPAIAPVPGDFMAC